VLYTHAQHEWIGNVENGGWVDYRFAGTNEKAALIPHGVALPQRWRICLKAASTLACRLGREPIPARPAGNPL
jgi:hypothetical protein